MKFWHKNLVLFLIICLAPAAASAQSLQDWPQWRGKDRDGNWSESGIVDKFDKDSLKVVWKTKISAGYTGPTVADGRVFVMDRQSEPKQVERVICLNQKTGKEIWKHVYDAEYKAVGYRAGPRASVSIDGGLAYSLGTMGHLHCLNAKDGKVVWSLDLNTKYRIVATRRMPIWGIAGSPIIYKDLVIIHLGGADDSCIVAFDKKTGKEKWRALKDRGQYSAPVLTKQNGKDVLICWTGDSVAGLSPGDGKVFWRYPFRPSRMPIGIATPLIKDNHIYLTSFYDGSLMLKMKSDEMAVEKVWQAVGPNERQTKALQSIISTPVWLGDHIYGVDSYGELRCIEAKTGKRIWENLSAVPRSRWSTIHFVQNGKQSWMFNERGELLLGELTPKGFKEISRAKLLEPTKAQLRSRGGVCWAHPAFAHRCIFVRNDNEIVCVSLAK